jgi:hypothetical protein
LTNLDIPTVIFTVLLTVAVLLSIVAVYIWLTALIKRFLGVKRESSHTLILKNQGNVPSVYQLTAASTDPRLSFRFHFRNIPLAEVPVAVPVIEHTNGSTASKAAAGKPKNAAAAANNVQKSGKAAARKSGEAANFLSALGNLLPGKIGKTLKSQGAAARDVQTKTSQTLRIQDQAERQVGAVQKGSSKLGVKAAAPALSTGGGQQQKVAAIQAPPAVVDYIQIAQTAPVGPGESLSLSLKIQSLKSRIPEGSFLYTISSQQVPLEKVDREIAPVTSQGTVHFDAVSGWRYALPVVMNVLVIAGCAFALAYALILIWA